MRCRPSSTRTDPRSDSVPRLILPPADQAKAIPFYRKPSLTKLEVRIKQFDVNMLVKSKGIEFEVRTPNGQSQVGDCYLTKTALIWCKGKTTRPNGIKPSWPELAEILGSEASKKVALAAVRNATP